MKSLILKKLLKAIYSALFLLVTIGVFSSFNQYEKGKPVTEKKPAIPVNFQVMMITKAKFETYWVGDIPQNKLKRFVVQFQASQNTAGDNFQYNMRGYIFIKPTGSNGTFTNDLSLIEPLPTPRYKPIDTEFTLTTNEFRRPEIRPFYEKIKATFEYLVLEPRKDANANIVIDITAYKGNIPIEIETLEKNIVVKRIAKITMNPCPPDIPQP